MTDPAPVSTPLVTSPASQTVAEPGSTQAIHELEQLLRVSRSSLRELLAACASPIIVVDRDGMVEAWNPAAQRLLGWQESEVLGCRAPVHSVPMPEVGLRTAPSPADPSGARGMGLRRDGAKIPLRVLAFPTTVDGPLHGGVILLLVPEDQPVAGQRQWARLPKRSSARRRAERGGSDLRGIQAIREAQARCTSLDAQLAERDQLILGFGHEIRNSLGTAATFAHLLESGAYGPLSQPQGVSVKRFRRLLSSALQLVTEMLDLQAARVRGVRVDWAVVDLRAEIGELVEEFRPRVQDAGMELQTQLGSLSRSVRTDMGRVRQILSNLILNAVQHAKAGPIRVELQELRSEETGVQIGISVSDSGPGIAREVLPRVFDGLVGARPRDSAGTGLGLAISRQLARALGGDLVVRSESGSGCTFTLILPHGPAPRSRRSGRRSSDAGTGNPAAADPVLDP